MRILARVTLIVLILGFSQDNLFAAGPRAWGKKGSATTTNAVITAPFYPTQICVRNDDATNGLYIDWTDGIATAADESTNLYFPPGVLECHDFLPNVSPARVFQIGVLAAAATAAYHINIIRGN